MSRQGRGAIVLAAVLLAGCAGGGSHPSTTPTPSASPLPAVTSAPPTTAPPTTGTGEWRIGPQSVPVDLLLATGTSTGVYGVEPVGDGPPYRGFRVVRLDPGTLQVTRTALIAGDPSGLAVDNRTVYVGVTRSRAVLRFSTSTLTPLTSWRDPVAVLLGPLAVTRSGLWVADAHGLTRLLGDGVQGGATAEQWPQRVLLQGTWDGPDLVGNSFWVTVDDSHGCPTLYDGSGPDGLAGHPVPVLRPAACDLGFGGLSSGPGGTLVSVPTGMQAQTQLLQLDPGTGRWVAHPGPGGSNSLVPSVTAGGRYVADVSWLRCLGADGRVRATLPLTASQSLPQVVQAGDRAFVVLTEGAAGTPTGPRVQPFQPARACGVA